MTIKVKVIKYKSKDHKQIKQIISRVQKVKRIKKTNLLLRKAKVVQAEAGQVQAALLQRKRKKRKKILNQILENQAKSLKSLHLVVAVVQAAPLVLLAALLRVVLAQVVAQKKKQLA